MVKAPPKTKSSTLRLSEVAREVRPPAGVVSTGFPAVRDKCRDLGITFRPWQTPVGQLILAKRADGKYAATVGGTGMSIPRQVGKTFLVGAIVFALCLLRPKLTVIWTAHRNRTAVETFGKMQAFAARKKIAPFVEKIVLGSGDEAIYFTNGSRILFGARERGFGRGFDEVDVLIFDEAQILTENALDDMIPATNQSRQDTGALLLFMGTPPKPKDPGEVFTRMRDEALAGEDADTCWVEFGCDPDYTPTPLPAAPTEKDWAQVAKANPSFPDDTSREAILRMRKKLGPDSYLREGMGRWGDGGSKSSVMPNWPHCATSTPAPDPVALGVAVDLDRVWASLAASSDGDRPHLGSVIRVRLAQQRDMFVKEAARISKERGIPVALVAKGPAGTLEQELRDAGAMVQLITHEEYVQACADLYDAVESLGVEHGAYADLDAAIEGAAWTAGARRVWSWKTGDASMLEAATVALQAAQNPAPSREFWGAFA